MKAGDRFKGWVESSAASWSDRVGGWWTTIWTTIVSKLLVGINPAANLLVKGYYTKVEADPNSTEDQKAFANLVLEGPETAQNLTAWFLAILGAIPGLMALGRPQANIIGYEQDKKVRSLRLDPLAVITAWWRKPEVYEKYFDDLRDQGWSEDRIEALKFYTKVMPPPRDLVGFLAHEVFEDDMIEKFSLLSEWGKIDKEFAKKIGLDEEILKLYWMDHWEHPGWTTIQELRHREKITDEDVKDWHRLVEIPEYWRDPMLETLWAVPNRIEIRMMARYLDLSKEDVMKLLGAAGLHPDYRSDAADFMIIMGLTGYWSSMLSKGWMNPDDLRADIDSRGLKPVTAERIYKTLVSSEQPEKVSEARDLTVAQIIRWVKIDPIGRYMQGVELLTDLNYSTEQSIFIMEGYLGEMGSPETYEDFKDLTTKYKIAIGKEAKPMPEELKKQAAEVVRLTKEVEDLNRSIEEEKRGLVSEEGLPEEATGKLKELQVSRNRAIAELEHAKSEYDRLVAEWKHGE